MIILSDQKRQLKEIRQEVDEAIKRVLDSGWYILGKELESFEKAFGIYCDDSIAVGVASGTEALLIALMDEGVVYGDEVITVPNTAVPTISAISSVGANPIFVDINEDTYLMDVSKIKDAITKKTKAIMPVHLYGQTVDMDPVIEIAREYGLKVIEDSCQAHGALCKGRKSGTIGDYGCFSFYPTKNLGALGDAGAIIVKEQQVAHRLKMLRNYGQEKRYYHEVKGINSRLDEIQAAVLNVKLKYLDSWNEKRRELAEIYKEYLQGLDIILPEQQEGSHHIYHLFVVRVDAREELIDYLNSKDIYPLIHYPLLITKQSAYKQCIDQDKNLLTANKVINEILSLPISPELTKDEVCKICECIREFYEKYRK